MNVKCPFCGWTSEWFYSHPQPNPRPNAFCPRCTSKERHRLLFLYLYRNGYFERDLNILEVGPEYCWKIFFDTKDNIKYTSFDLAAPQADIHGNIEESDLPSNEYDIVICYSVLEHVQNDRAAIAELYRVLKPSGELFTHVPIFGYHTNEEVLEDPKERERLYLQADHVRMYGWDFVERLREPGFEVEVIHYALHALPDTIRRLGILRNDYIIKGIKDEDKLDT